VTYMAPKS